MLLITMPYSAGTSLIHSLKDISGKYINLGIAKCKIDKLCEGYEELPKYYRDMAKRKDEHLKDMIENKQIIFREHLIPSKEHLKYMEKYLDNVVVLLRDPIDVYQAFQRYNKEYKEQTGKEVNLQLIYYELINFYNAYICWTEHKKNFIVIMYEDLILRPIDTLRRIMKYFKMKPIKEVKLKKINYTGISRKKRRDLICY